ncbi:hypothetical protein BTJ68_11400, partial [Hortaea werneckii EXF-2000]
TPIRRPFAVDESLSLQRHRHCKLLGQTTALDACLIGLGSFNEKNETASRVGTLRQVGGSEYFSTYDDADVPVPDDETRALAEIEAVVGRHGPALIDIYFRNVHPSYPILQKSALLDRIRHDDLQFNPASARCMYVLALSWWDRRSGSGAASKARHCKAGARCYDWVDAGDAATEDLSGTSGFHSARTLVYIWTARAGRFQTGEKRLRKRLAWALYMQDKWSALMHGRPSHINAADWSVREPAVEDFDENIPPFSESASLESEDEAETTKGRTIFMQMIQLTRLLSDICDVFYSQTAKQEYARAGRFATQLVLNRAKPVQLRLKEWFAKLPPGGAKMDNYTPWPRCPQLGIYIWGTSQRRSASIAGSYRVWTLPSATRTCSTFCRSAAKTRLISAMDYVNRLKPEHLDAFWYFASASNFSLIGTFGSLLLATSPGQEEAEFYASRLQEFKWTLGVSAKKASWIQGAMDMLEANGGDVAGSAVEAANDAADEEEGGHGYWGFHVAEWLL